MDKMRLQRLTKLLNCHAIKNPSPAECKAMNFEAHIRDLGIWTWRIKKIIAWPRPH